jgi:nucleotide-binding universal stress UspA family protein
MHHAVIRVAADGSAGSRRAFGWAVEEAVLRGCSVEIVSVYGLGPAETLDERVAAAEARVHSTMDPVMAGRVEVPSVSWHVVEGEPAEVLIRESADSQLLVMGSHGVSGLRHSALGSVADLCARMAACPVVVIPPPTQETAHGELSTVG